MILPALVPGIISAIAFRIYARWLGIEPGMGAIIWAHAVHNVPFVTIVVMARLSTLPKSQIEAARDLGADPLLTFIRITLPYLIPAILGASLFCLLLSFDDFVRSFFLGDYIATLPVLIFANYSSASTLKKLVKNRKVEGDAKICRSKEKNGVIDDDYPLSFCNWNE